MHPSYFVLITGNYNIPYCSVLNVACTCVYYIVSVWLSGLWMSVLPGEWYPWRSPMPEQMKCSGSSRLTLSMTGSKPHLYLLMVHNIQLFICVMYVYSLPSSKQIDLYDETFRPIVDAVLEGYNGKCVLWNLVWTFRTSTSERDLLYSQTWKYSTVAFCR